MNAACELWCVSVLLQPIFVPLVMHVVHRKLCVVPRLSLTWMPIGFEVVRGGPLMRKSPFSVIDPLAPLLLVFFLNLACVRFIGALLGTHPGTDVATGATVTGPETVSQPGLFGPATQPHQLPMKVWLLAVVFTKPAALPVMELVDPPTTGTTASDVLSSINLMPATVAAAMLLQVSVPVELSEFPPNDSAATPMLPPWMVLSVTVASPESRTMPSKRLLVSVFPLIVVVPSAML